MNRRWWIVERDQRIVVAIAGLVVIGTAVVLAIRNH
jgi:hypothetical protein